MTAPIGLHQMHPVQDIRPKAEQEAKLREAAQMYERHFLNEIFKAMRKTVPEGEGILPGSFAQRVYRDQLDEQYVDAWKEKGGIGLTDMIFNQLKEQVLGRDSNLPAPRGPLSLPSSAKPIGVPDQESTRAISKGEKSASLILQYSPNQPIGRERDVTSPWSGRLLQSFRSPGGRCVSRIDHGEGVESILNFIGYNSPSLVGKELEAGQKVGLMEAGSEAMAWTVTKNVINGA
ncbi:MAG: rod-binding protein [Bdellovibrionales bacterium]|nr:rod-binding protein [Bdellovibrionales bacterium]